MNNKGKQYIQDIQSKYKKLPIQARELFDIKTTDSSIYERLMRLGQESRYYELNTDEEHRQVALATLKEDFVLDMQSKKDIVKHCTIMLEYYKLNKLAI